MLICIGQPASIHGEWYIEIVHCLPVPLAQMIALTAITPHTPSPHNTRDDDTSYLHQPHLLTAGTHPITSSLPHLQDSSDAPTLPGEPAGTPRDSCSGVAHSSSEELADDSVEVTVSFIKVSVVVLSLYVHKLPLMYSVAMHFTSTCASCNTNVHVHHVN